MNKLILSALVAASLIMGCKKKKPTEAALPVMDLVPVELATPAQAATGQGTGPEFEALHQALEQWVPLNGYPTNLSILVAAKLVPQLPPLPPGKKFAIDQARLRVILVNQ